MINDNGNEAKNEYEDHRSQRYNINRPRTSHGHKYTKYKNNVSQYNDGYIYLATSK